MYMVCPSICKATDVRMKSEKPEKKSKQPLMIFLKGIGHFLTDGVRSGEGFPVDCCNDCSPV